MAQPPIDLAQYADYKELPIAPCYWMSKPNEDLNLGNHPVEFTRDGKTHTLNAHVKMRLGPDERVEIYVPSTESLSMQDLLGTASVGKTEKLAWTETNVSTEVFCLRSGCDGILFCPTYGLVAWMQGASTICRATLALFNLPNFISPDHPWLLSKGGGLTRIPFIPLEGGGWSIRIAGTEDTDDNVQQLKETGGFITTHVASLQRQDGKCFSNEELKEAIDLLHDFLSFGAGRWIGIACPVAFDEAGKRVWEAWGMTRAHRGADITTHSWTDRHHPEMLAAAFPGFAARYRDSVWKEPLRKILYWYIRANSSGYEGGQDAGLVLAQSALELLAWTHCTQDRRMISEKAFQKRGLSADDRMRLLASSLNIPMNIPASIASLQSKPGQPWCDIPEVITHVRNQLVHPTISATKVDYYDCWRIALWFIELAVLRICKAEGSYSNRLLDRKWVGEIEPLPWSKP